MWRVPNANRAAMKKATVIGILCLVLLQFSQTACSKGPEINVAYQRPVKTNIRTGQSQGKPIHAVDDAFEKETCFENSKKLKAPWLQIDLGKQLWVEKVRIMSKKALSNIDIRIGNSDNDFTSNPLCLKSVLIPRAPTLFSCAEPMLGRYVYIVAKDYIKLCDVQIFLNADATDTNINYLAGSDSQDKGMLKKGKYNFEDLSPGDDVEIVLPHRKLRVKRKDLVIDLPPNTESLTLNTAVLIPVQWNEDSSKDKCGSRQGKLEQKYINGAVGRVQDSGVVTIKALYTSDICQLQNKCGDSYGSKCDTEFISPLFPPGSYYCKCNPGFVSSSSTTLPIANYVAPGEKCINGRPEIWHSKQNLALMKKAIASSTDKGLAKFVVDGDPGTCFMSHTGKKPWLILYLGDFQPVSLVRIHSAKSQGDKTRMKDVGVFAGGRNHYIKCAFEKSLNDDRETSYQCSSDLYVFVNSVKITTEAPVLQLCEVEVYAYTYGNVIGRKHFTYIVANDNDMSRLAIDGDADTCFKARTDFARWFWMVTLGKNVRVELVFILLHAKFQYQNVKIKIDEKECLTIRAYGARRGNYFECRQPITGSELLITWTGEVSEYIQICEVEVFQTKIINLAGKRPTKSSTNEKESHIGCDQKLDKPFSTGVKPSSKEIKWWSVDLIALCKIHVVRIVTVSGYKPQHLKGLKVLIDAGEDAFGKGRQVASLDSPTKEPVQTIILQKNIIARFVTLVLQNEGQELRFREVEVYNGPLLAIDECKKPNICPSNLKCVDGKKSSACVCPDGFRIIQFNKCEGNFCDKSFGSYKDVNECEDPSRNSCGSTAVCVNTVGSYNCTCKQGHKFDENDLECKDINECENPLWNKCGDTSTCVNAPGSYKCSCREGYKLEISDLKYQCKDIDECATKDSCHVDASCYNTHGSYECTCHRGLGGDGYKSCSKLPRCYNGQCNENAICKDFDGNYLCECRGGYYFSGKMCVEINECKLNKDICGSNSVCSNTWGSYRCNCEVGFESRNGDGKNCSEIDECEKREICGDSATCENTVGSFKCICPDGFTFDTKTRICVDLDECTISHSCNPNMICTNTFGSYACSCRRGYRSDKMQCAEIDECQEETDDCPKFSRCKNQNGGYECLCKEGYRKASDGTCSAICIPECEKNSYCQDGKCSCKRGFSMGLDLTCKAATASVESSGVSIHSRVLFLMIALLWFLVLLWFMVLL